MVKQSKDTLNSMVKQMVKQMETTQTAVPRETPVELVGQERPPQFERDLLQRAILVRDGVIADLKAQLTDLQQECWDLAAENAALHAEIVRLDPGTEIDRVMLLHGEDDQC